MLAQFVHCIDPVMAELGAVKLWYYGLAYAVGFLGVYAWSRLRSSGLGADREASLDLTLMFGLAVLICGRAFEIIVYEWSYYSTRPHQVFSYWRGGMASHGVLIGGVLGTWWWCRVHDRKLLQTLDAVVIPAAVFLALGRVGNFINGQIYGSVTDVWWAVKFPGQDSFRHPVTLYEALKNLMLVPILLVVRRREDRADGLVLAHFVLWYGFLRIVTDVFRDYGPGLWGVMTGQYVNVLMAVAGLGLVLWRSKAAGPTRTSDDDDPPGPDTRGRQPGGKRMLIKWGALLAMLCLCLVIPSGWTQGVLQAIRGG